MSNVRPLPAASGVMAAAVAMTLAVMTALIVSACGSSPSTTPGGQSTAISYRGTFASSNYAPAVLDVALTGTASGFSGSQTVTGTYSTSNGITGQINGTVSGTLSSGGFQGALTYDTSPLGGKNCNGTGTFTGTISSASGIDWTSSGFSSSCPGDPKEIHATAAPGGTGPSPTPTGGAFAGTWNFDPSVAPASLVLTQSGTRVSGSLIFQPSAAGFPFTYNSTISGTVSGATVTGTNSVRYTATDTSTGRTASCTWTDTFTAQVTGSTMTGIYNSATVFTCDGKIVPVEPSPDPFTLTKQ